MDAQPAMPDAGALLAEPTVPQSVARDRGPGVGEAGDRRGARRPRASITAVMGASIEDMTGGMLSGSLSLPLLPQPQTPLSAT